MAKLLKICIFFWPQNGTAPIETKLNNVTTCRYPEFRNPYDDARPYKRGITYWHILAARLAFLVLFEVIEDDTSIKPKLTKIVSDLNLV